MALRESDLDTIVAIATAPGEAGIGIVRISGARSLEIAQNIFRAHSGKSISSQKSFTVRYGYVVAPATKKDPERLIDEALLFLMRAPKSYTCEDVAELQAHGSAAALQEVLALVIRQGARMAGPGEFTKRAFMNGRIDLVQAEAVLDMIQAKSEKGLRWASAQLEGSLSKKAVQIKTCLLEALGSLEASIDFPEDDLDAGNHQTVLEKCECANGIIRSLLNGAETAIRVKRGVIVSLWGRPNTGKSSLLNSLARHHRVIVAPAPGTTRDVVEEEALIGGFLVRLQDTAGIQATSDPVEKEGVERSRKAAMGAGIVLFVVDASRVFSDEDMRLYREIENKPRIVVLNKSDLFSQISEKDAGRLFLGSPIVRASSVREDGVKALEQAIVSLVTGGDAQAPDEVIATSVRQKEALEKMQIAMADACQACRVQAPAELVAVDVRLAMHYLGTLVGEIVTDEVLDVLFNQFCIGK